ncbi:penicillin-binding protein 2 [Dongia rigui]|uniref:Penicillin-binding protein 2 n=1 Tax=Dongia rigui TaxID=940149 RepID=A0ABU5DUK4_9PROT|nr:penicillin-binding protein 2 [Dongia rigui]MDY0870637.1 penicillin-binding protein 2 [Dongia rigui]
MAGNKQQAQNQAKVFSRRAMIMGGMQAGLVGTLIARLYYLQVVESEKYRLLADENRINLRLLPPSRGLILDRFGVPLAANFPNYRAILVAEQTKDLEQTLGDFARLVPLTERERAKVLRELKRNRAFTPIPVKEDLSWDQMSQVELNLPELPGISIEEDQKRYYPFAGLTAHILGYVQTASESEVAADSDPLLTLPGFRIGRNGLEKTYDRSLRGSAGKSEMEVNSVGRIIRQLSRVEGKPGADLVTTIDIGLQEFAQQRIAAEQSCSTVVMDIFTGEVLAMASTPSFDPASFYRGISGDEWRTLNADMFRPLTNKTVSDGYAPGSTFKIVTTMAAQAAGISPSFSVFCPGFYTFGPMRLHCWKKEGHGHVSMADALKHSCDVYYYDVAKRVGIDAIAEMARKFGLGQPTGVDLPGENPGVIPDQQWKISTLGEKWYPGETLVAGIGQGFIQATPLQLCLMTARVANGGFAIKPRLFKRYGAAGSDEAYPPLTVVNAGQESDAAPKMDVKQEHLAIIRRGMDLVTNDQRGTAYRRRIDIPGMEMAGKTGTSQVRRITMSERATGVRKNEDLPWPQRDHALFVAFAPVHQPRYAISVVIEHGGGGSTFAAPIARDILIECQRRDPARRNPNDEGGRREMP